MTEKDNAQDQLKNIPIKAGDRFKHYRAGGIYEIVNLAIKEDTLEPLVIYKKVDTNDTWARTYENWSEEVELDGKPIKRFQKIEK